MKIYADKNYTCEVDNNCLDLGVVSAGDTKQFEFYVKNDTKASLRELKFYIKHNEVKILEAPQSLNAEDVHILRIQWSPSITLKEGLHTALEIEGKEIWN